MKKLLYIIGNSKLEEYSSSRIVSRRLVDAIVRKFPDILLEELDLYNNHIPQLKGSYFGSRNAIVDMGARGTLSEDEQKEVAIIEQLCDQFIQADIYVLAAPMWSLSFPAPVKEYLDCIIQSGKTIAFQDNMPHGLLNEKHRAFFYVQSSGANIPWILKPALNKGLNYFADMMSFIGIDAFEELLVDGTGTTEEERQSAIQKAMGRIDPLVAKLV
jgi:FMN-dependent NADH-azoreductase